MTDMQTEEHVVTKPAEPGDHDTFAHYVEKDKIADAIIFGTPLLALCGKMWIPFRKPEDYPVCPTCKEVYETLNNDLNE